MNKKIKILIILALVVGLFGGFTDFLSPSLRIDEDEFLRENGYTEALSMAPIVSAQGAILIDGKGNVIYEKDADKRLYPASTTKIMTALVSLEILEEIDGVLGSKVKIPKEAVGVEGSSINLTEGEEVTVEELLYGTMLQSGNDAATALACCLCPNMSVFVEKMNKKAKELGCLQTNFVNPSGLFDENHYTTARDLAYISAAAMKNDTFRRIVGTQQWKSDATGRNIVNKNKTIYQYENATGIKIGYTKKSGRTLVASAKKNEVELIAVVLNDGNWFQDAYAMLDYGFESLE